MSVNRSVVSGVIAAGVLSAATTIALAPVAAADPVGPAVTDGAETGAADGPGAGGRRPHARGAGQAQTGSRAAPPEWLCPWDTPWPVNRPVPPRNSNLFGQVPAVAPPQVPTAQISGGVRDDLPDLTSIEALAEPPDAPVPAAETPAPQAYPAFTPVPLEAPGRFRPAAPAAGAPVRPPAAPPPAPAPRVIPAVPAPQSPASDAPPPERMGYPDDLRTAGTAAIAAQALPGLAAILGMTALGGVVGYRQARAGYVLRTAGAARFLQ